MTRTEAAGQYARALRRMLLYLVGSVHGSLAGEEVEEMLKAAREAEHDLAEAVEVLTRPEPAIASYQARGIYE